MEETTQNTTQNTTSNDSVAEETTQNTTSNNSTAEESSGTGSEKLFSQDDVNRIVSERLARERSRGGDGWKEKHDNIKQEFEAYRASIETQKARAVKEKAARAYLESKGIKETNLEIAMRGIGAEVDALELENDAIKDTAALDALVNGVYSSLVSKKRGYRINMGATCGVPIGNNGCTRTIADAFKPNFER